MKGQGSKLFVVTVAFLLIAGACAPAATPPPTPTPVPPTATPVPPTATPVPPTATPAPPTPTSPLLDIAGAYFDAFNGQDVDGILALFTDDALNHAFCHMPVVVNAKNAKDQLRNMYEQFAGLGATLEPGGCELQGGGVKCPVVIYRDNCLDVGSAVYHLSLKFMFKDERIVTLFGPVMVDEAKTVHAAHSERDAWLEKNRPDEMAKFNNPAEWEKFTDPSKPGTLTARQMGELASDVCAAYRAAQK